MSESATKLYKKMAPSRRVDSPKQPYRVPPRLIGTTKLHSARLVWLLWSANAGYPHSVNRPPGKLTVFLGSALALVLASAIGVAAGALLSQVINARMMSMIAGAGFIVIGIFTFYHGWQNAA